MSLPANLSTGVVTGTFTKLDGTPAAGTVVFRPAPARLLDANADVIVVCTALTVALDAAGSFTITLPATDDPDVSPTGWTYAVTAQVVGADDFKFDMAVPSSTTTNIADVAPSTATGGVATGAGLPSGGTVGLTLVKQSSTNYDAAWATVGTGPAFTIAAADSALAVRRRADVVLTGTADQVAINTYAALGKIQLADGNYSITAPILLSKVSSILEGTGLGEDMAAGNGGRGFGARIELDPSFAGLAAIIVDQANRPAGKSIVRNLTIDGNDILPLVGGPVDGIRFRAYQGQLASLDVLHMSGNGYHVLGYTAGVPAGAVDWTTYDTNLTLLHAASCALDGLRLGVNAADIHLSTSTFHNNGGSGLHIAGGASAQGTNIHCYGNAEHGAHFEGVGARTKLTNLKVEHSFKHGVFFDGTNGGASGIQLNTVGMNCNGKGNQAGTGAPGGGVYSHIAFGGSGGSAGPFTGVTMDNLQFGNSDNVVNLAKYCIDMLYSGTQTHSAQWSVAQMSSTLAGAGVTTARVNYGNSAIRAQIKHTNVRGGWDWNGTVAPASAAGSAAGGAPPAPVLAGTDSAGLITFGSGTTPAAGQMVTVTYSIPMELSPGGKIQLTPINNASFDLGLVAPSAGSTTTGFAVNSRNAPAASQANTAFGFYYRVDV